MVADRNGNTIQPGDSLVIVGKARGDEQGVLVRAQLGNGEHVRVLGSDCLRAQDLDAFAKALGELSDVSVAEAGIGARLEFNGSAWVAVIDLPEPTAFVVANALAEGNPATMRANLGLGAAALQALNFWLQAGQNLADLGDPAQARLNLELGSAAEEDASVFALASHSHDSLSVVWRDHFIYAENSNWDTVSTGTAASYHQNAAGMSSLDAHHAYGVWRIHCGDATGTGSYASYNAQEIGQQGRVLESTGDWKFRFRAATNNRSDLKAAFGLAFGDLTGLRQANSATFELDNNTSTNIWFVVNDGTTTTTVDTGVSIESVDLNSGSGDFSWFEIWTKSGRIQAVIDGVVVATVTTNLPTADNQNMTPSMVTVEDGATYRGLLWDYVDLLAPSDWMPPGGS